MGNPIVASKIGLVRPKSGPASPPGHEQDSTSWQATLRNAIRDPDELCRVLSLSAEWPRQARRAAEVFGLFAPRGYVARMRCGDPHDPLLRQVLPLDDEMRVCPGFTTDPVGDLAAKSAPGILHKYSGRALLIVTGTCAIHCRYCFRRHYPYGDEPRSLDEWQPALDQIAADPTIREVILSGGDPLTVVDQTLERLVDRLSQIDHVARLRIHSRLPVVIPERVTDSMLAWFCGGRLKPVMVIHANHAAELDANVAFAMKRLSRSGAMLLNQAVLLRGVNDQTETLRELSERLVDLGVAPYYLHQLDRVAGAVHFEVPEEVGRRLVGELRSLLPGYAVPRYVRETPGDRSKTILM